MDLLSRGCGYYEGGDDEYWPWFPGARYLKVIIICCTDMKSDCYEKELILNLRSLSTNISGIAFNIYRDLTVEDKEIHGCTEWKHYRISHTMDLNHFRCSFDNFRWFTRHRGPSRRLNWCRHYRSNRCMCQNVWKSISNIWFETTVRPLIPLVHVISATMKTSVLYMFILSSPFILQTGGCQG